MYEYYVLFHFLALDCTDTTVTDTKGIVDGDLRLSGGQTANEGRVEIFFDGYWGTVCDQNWDLLDAIVACHQLGYSTAAAALTGSAFGIGSEPNWLISAHCTGYEDNLIECRLSDGNSSCRSEHAGVICSSKQIHLNSCGTVLRFECMHVMY